MSAASAVFNARRYARRRRLTASDITIDESDIEENGSEGDKVAATMMMAARMTVTVAAVVREQAWREIVENERPATRSHPETKTKQEPLHRTAKQKEQRRKSLQKKKRPEHPVQATASYLQPLSSSGPAAAISHQLVAWFLLVCGLWWLGLLSEEARDTIFYSTTCSSVLLPVRR
jgi:hypothetical protein